MNKFTVLGVDLWWWLSQGCTTKQWALIATAEMLLLTYERDMEPTWIVKG